MAPAGSGKSMFNARSHCPSLADARKGTAFASWARISMPAAAVIVSFDDDKTG
jgi:hypothetical protein